MLIHKHTLSALLAALVLATAVGTASAGRLSTSSQTNRITWAALTFSSGGGLSISCPITLEGTMHSATIAKTRGLLIGSIVRATLSRPCTGGTVEVYNGSEVNEVLGGTLSNSLPWHITYEGFGGTLPTITEVLFLLIRARFIARATILGIPVLCSYTNTLEHPDEGAIKLGRGGIVSSIRPNETVSIPSESGGTCPEGVYTREGVATNGSGGNITITLI